MLHVAWRNLKIRNIILIHLIYWRQVGSWSHREWHIRNILLIELFRLLYHWKLFDEESWLLLLRGERILMFQLRCYWLWECVTSATCAYRATSIPQTMSPNSCNTSTVSTHCVIPSVARVIQSCFPLRGVS
jgi:hypothetical protein